MIKGCKFGVIYGNFSERENQRQKQSWLVGSLGLMAYQPLQVISYQIQFYFS